MKLNSGLVLLVFVFAFTVNGYGQEPASAAENAEKLRAQLLEVQAKEEELHVRAQQLEESLKPENIERSLAGVGSTRPEELRESQRRQLTIERDGVLAQLKTLETSRLRLEAAIGEADALAYQQSARTMPAPSNQMMAASLGLGYQWLMLGGGGFAALALAGGVLLYRRKIRLR
jgi:hypothetical protein